MTRQQMSWYERITWYGVIVLALGMLAIGSFGQNIGTVRQPLVGGSVIDQARQEEFGLLAFTDGIGSVCSASLLRNGWAVTAARCVDYKDGKGGFIPDPARPGRNLMKPIYLMTLTAN